MANAQGSANVRNIIQTGKTPLLPPKIPFPGTSAVHSDYSSNALLGSKLIPSPKDANAYHQRTSSESFPVEEQPSWLDDLLDEPETPVRRGHRRSSSDSFAYMDVAGVSDMDYASTLHDESKYRNVTLAQLWGSQNINHSKDIQKGSSYADSNSYGKPRNRIGEWLLTSATHPGTLLSSRDNSICQSARSSSVPEEADPLCPTASDKEDHGESGLADAKHIATNKEDAHTKLASENDTKHAKQQFAQCSRVRKLQYIAELERKVQALQAEGSEVSAELEFLNQQILILRLENKALKQRSESLAQEQLIKRLEHELLEREIGRLRTLYQQQLQQQQQQQQQQPLKQPKQQQRHRRQSSSIHRRASSKDLDSQFAKLSTKHKDVSTAPDTVRI